ncbi:hypothetical protein BC826DRAFT_1101894 [Russula brevipes]|nr:hypothetical protein BC826DRAFT_1101894 [Russula brevipes]
MSHYAIPSPQQSLRVNEQPLPSLHPLRTPTEPLRYPALPSPSRDGSFAGTYTITTHLRGSHLYEQASLAASSGWARPLRDTAKSAVERVESLRTASSLGTEAAFADGKRCVEAWSALPQIDNRIAIKWLVPSPEASVLKRFEIVQEAVWRCQHVNIYRLTIEKTVGERILALQDSAAAALGGDKVKKLGLEDLMALFRPGRDDGRRRLTCAKSHLSSIFTPYTDSYTYIYIMIQ